MCGVGRGEFLEDFSPETPVHRARPIGHSDTRSRPLNTCSSADLTWEALTAVNPGGTG